LDTWDDRRIEAGTDWFEEIQEAMSRASVAVAHPSADQRTTPPDKLISRDPSLSGATRPYLARVELVFCQISGARRKSSFSPAAQPYLGALQRYLARDKFIFRKISEARRKISLFPTLQAYLGEINLIWPKVRLLFAR
jgi:hypothetical protein